MMTCFNLYLFLTFHRSFSSYVPFPSTHCDALCSSVPMNMFLRQGRAKLLGDGTSSGRKTLHPDLCNQQQGQVSSLVCCIYNNNLNKNKKSYSINGNEKPEYVSLTSDDKVRPNHLEGRHQLGCWGELHPFIV